MPKFSHYVFHFRFVLLPEMEMLSGGMSQVGHTAVAYPRGGMGCPHLIIFQNMILEICQKSLEHFSKAVFLRNCESLKGMVQIFFGVTPLDPPSNTTVMDMSLLYSIKAY